MKRPHEGSILFFPLAGLSRRPKCPECRGMCRLILGNTKCVLVLPQLPFKISVYFSAIGKLTLN